MTDRTRPCDPEGEREIGVLQLDCLGTARVHCQAEEACVLTPRILKQNEAERKLMEVVFSLSPVSPPLSLPLGLFLRVSRRGVMWEFLHNGHTQGLLMFLRAMCVCGHGQ